MGFSIVGDIENFERSMCFEMGNEVGFLANLLAVLKNKNLLKVLAGKLCRRKTSVCVILP